MVCSDGFFYYISRHPLKKVLVLSFSGVCFHRHVCSEFLRQNNRFSPRCTRKASKGVCFLPFLCLVRSTPLHSFRVCSSQSKTHIPKMCPSSSVSRSGGNCSSQLLCYVSVLLSDFFSPLLPFCSCFLGTVRHSKWFPVHVVQST